MTPRLSVVIPTHDKLPQLQRTLAALQLQDLPTEQWEVVVVDDGCSDGTGAWLTEEAPRWDGRLRVASPGRNLGRARARTLGGNEAAGEWILFLDDDILAPPGLLAAHLEILSAERGCGVIGLVRTEPQLVDAPHFHYIDTRGAAKIRGDRVPARYLVTQNTSIPRAHFLDIGGFDAAFAAYGFEDMDLGFRLEDTCGTVFRPMRSPIPLHVHHHDLDAWLDKKRECGHGPLQRIAETHPGRLREMGLHLVLEPPGAPKPSPLVRLLRRLARSPLAAGLRGLVRRWPTTAESRPRWAALHARTLDLLVLAAYCQGVTDGVSGRVAD